MTQLDHQYFLTVMLRILAPLCREAGGGGGGGGDCAQPISMLQGATPVPSLSHVKQKARGS